MAASILIGLREGLEAALIVGLAKGILSRIGKRSLQKVVWAGVAAAVVISLLVAGLLLWVGMSLEG